MSTSPRPEPALLSAEPVPALGPSPGYRLYLAHLRRRRTLVRGCQGLLLVVVLLAWQLSAQNRWVNPMLTSDPTAIVATIGQMMHSGTLFSNTWVTAQETLTSFALGLGGGLVVAVLIWWSPFLSRVLDPYLVLLNALPKIALGPILFIWLGSRLSVYGMAVAINAVVTIIMLATGFQETAHARSQLMETLGATRWQTLRIVVLPASLPTVVAAAKVCLGLTLVGVIAGEFLASKAGLGFEILYGSQVFQMNLVMASITMVAAISAALYLLVAGLGAWLLHRFRVEG